MGFSYEDWQARQAAPRGLAEQAGSPQTTGSNTPPADPVAAAPGTAERQFGLQDWQTRRPQWATGGTMAGTANGWGTPFMREFQERYWGTDAAPVSDQDRHNYWDSGTATGIVLADQGAHKFGDVFQGGQKVGNIRTSYDQQTADMLLGQLTLSATELADATNPEMLHRAVETRAADSARQIAASLSREDYESDVAAQKRAWDGTSELGAAAAGAAGGAVLGAAFGPIGAGVGAVVGAGAALWNRDQMDDVAARAAVQYDMAGGDLTAAALFAGASGWGRYAMQSITPLTNTVNAAYDEWGAKESSTGDGMVHTAWEGGGAWKAMQLGAGFADGLLTFGSGLGLQAYTAAMLPVALGKAGSLVTSGTFDETSGTFDKPDDAAQWAAGIADVGIDVVQMGLARALGGAALVEQGVFAGSLRSFGNRTVSRVTPQWVRPGDGRAYLLNAEGTAAVRSRWTSAMLAPSEFVGAMNTRVEALRIAAKEGGAVTADTLYTAARRLESSGTFRASLVNAFGEGSEEALQAFVEPISHGWQASMSDIVAAYAQGAAMGAGMTVGSRSNRTGSGTSQASYVAANVRRNLLGEPEIAPEAWAKMSRTQRRRELSASKLEAAAARAGAEQVAKDFLQEKVDNEAWVARTFDASVSLAEKEANRANPMTERAYKIAGLASVHIPQHAVVGSAKTIVEMLHVYKRKALTELSLSTDDAQKLRGSAQLAQLDILLNSMAADMKVVLDEQMRRPVRVAAIGRVNATLKQAYEGYDENATASEQSIRARVATLDMSRDPNDNPGSFQLLMPQVSVDSTLIDNNGFLQVGFGVLQGLSADYDGDMLTHRTRFDPDDERFLQLRSGQQYLGNVEFGVNIMEPPFELAETRAIALALDSANNASNAEAQRFLDTTVAELKARYQDAQSLHPAFDAYAEHVRKGDIHARMHLLEELVSPKHAETLLRLGRTTRVLRIGKQDIRISAGTNHLLEISGIILRGVDAWQGATAGSGKSAIDERHIVSRRAHSTKYPARQPVAGPTPGTTLLSWLQGSDQFRKFQKLHHSVYRSAVSDADLHVHVPSDMLVEFYTLISGKQSVSELDLVYGKDEVTRTAMVMVERIRRAYSSDGIQLSLAQTLSLSVPNVTRDMVFHGGATSVAQLVLRDVAQQFASSAAEDPQLEAKFALYQRADQSTAIFELLEPYTMYELLQRDAGDFGSNLTLGQVVQEYAAQGANSRQTTKSRLTSAANAAYVHKARKDRQHGDPFDVADLDAGVVSDYAIISDVLLEVGNGVIAFNRDAAGGKTAAAARNSLTGRLATQSNLAHDAFIDAIKTIGDTLSKLDSVLREHPAAAKLVRGKDGYSVTQMSEILRLYPDISAGMADLLPDEIVNLVLTPNAEGGVDVSRWFVEMLALPPEQAAMSLLRNTLLLKLNALQMQGDETKLLRSSDRLVDLVLQMQQADDVSALRNFRQLLFSSTNVHVFMWEVNSRFVANEAPLTAWSRDSSLVTTVTAGGNWSSVDPTKDMRDAMTALKTKADRWFDAVNQYAAYDESDAKLVSALLHASKQRDANRETNEQLLLDRLTHVLELSRSRRSTLGPKAMMQALYANAFAFFDNATDKGQAPTAHSYNGVNATREDVPEWATGYEQLVSQVTGHSVEDVARNPQTLQQQAKMRVIDATGRLVDWTALDARGFLEQWNTGDPARIAMLKALVFPTAYEMTRPGMLGQQLLVEGSLSALLNRSFDMDVMAGMSFHDKLVFASSVEAQAQTKSDKDKPNARRTEVVQRLVSDLTTARLLNLRHRGDTTEIKAVADQALEDVVDAIRAMLQGDPVEARKLHAELVRDRKLSEIADTSDPHEIEQYRQVLATGLFQSLESSGSTPEEKVAAMERFNDFISGSSFAYARRMFQIDWTGTQVASQQAFIYNYLTQHRDMLTRVPSASTEMLSILNAGVDALGNPRKVAVDNKDAQKIWDAAVNGILSAYVAEATSITGPGLATSLIPTGDKSALARYYDKSFSYLWDDVLNPDSILMQGARDVQKMYGRAARTTSDTISLVRAIERISDPEKLGTWTDVVAAMSIVGQERIDSSGAGQQVARSGASPEKQNALSAYGRRNFLLQPLPEHMTTFELSADILLPATIDPTLRRPIDPTQPGNPLYLGMLEGRFVSGARVVFAGADGVDRKPMDLWNLAQPIAVPSLVGGDATFSSDLRVISLDSIRSAWETVLSALPAGSKKPRLQLDVVDPRKQPAAKEWANNGYFTGVVTVPAADVYDSPNGALWFMPGGLNQAGQKLALESSKKGTQAVYNADRIGVDVIEAAHTLGRTDYFGMLEDLTEHLLSTSMGGASLAHNFRIAVFDHLKHTHAVRGWVTLPDGSRQAHLLSSEQVIAAQQAGKDLTVGTLLLEGAEIITIPEAAFRTLHGDQSRFALTRALTRTPQPGSQGLDVNTGAYDRDVVLQRLPGLLEMDENGFVAADLFDSPVARRAGMQRSGRASRMMTNSEIDMLRTREVGFAKLADEIHQRRVVSPVRNDETLGYQARGAARVGELGKANSWGTGTISRALQELGINLDISFAADSVAAQQLLQSAMRKLHAVQDFSEGARTGWSLVFDTTGSRKNGFLHGAASLTMDAGDHDSKAEWVAPGDLVNLDTTTIPSNYPESKRRELILSAVDALTDRGVIVGLITPAIVSDDKAMIAQHLRERGYKRVQMSDAAWAPIASSDGYLPQMSRSLLSMKTTTRVVDSRAYVSALLALNIHVDENFAVLFDPAAAEGREVLVTRDLVPVNAVGGFGRPVSAEDDRAVAALVEYLATPEGLEYLTRVSAVASKSGALTREEELDLTGARDRMVEEFERAGRTGFYTRERTLQPGDILPLVRQGRTPQVILYRHGYEPIKSDDQLLDMLSVPRDENGAPGPLLGAPEGNVAIYGPRMMPDATTHTGTVVSWEPTKRVGLSVVERIPLQALANKTVFELNGFKLLTIAPDGAYDRPAFGMLPGVELDILSSWRKDSLSKENFSGVVNTAQNAIGYLGLDLMPIYMQALGATTEQQVIDILTLVTRTRGVGEDPATVDAAMSLERTAVAALDPQFENISAALLGRKLDASWVNAVRSESPTVEQKILRAALTYLMMSGAEVEHVLGANGFAAESGTAEVVESTIPPEMFTQVFDQDIELRSWLVQQLNRKMQSTPRTSGSGRAGYSFDNNFIMTVHNEDDSRTLYGYLQFTEAHSAGDNPVLSAMAADRKGFDPLSGQRTKVAEHAAGVQLFQRTDLPKTQRYLERAGAKDLSDVQQLGSLFFNAPELNPDGTRKHQRRVRFGLPTFSERRALELNRAAMRSTRVAIDTSGWVEPEKNIPLFEERRIALMHSLGLTEEQAPIVDYWVRQWLGAPKAPLDEDKNGADNPSANRVLDALIDMQLNVDHGDLPLAGASIPTMHIDDLALLFRANDNINPRFVLNYSAGLTYADSWDRWVHVALSQAEGAFTTFDPLFLVVNDGLMNTYSVVPGLGSLPPSMNTLRNLALLDPTRGDIIVTVDPNMASALREPLRIDTDAMTYSQLYQGQLRSGGSTPRTPPASSAIARQREKISKWRRKEGLSAPESYSYKDIASSGVSFVEKSMPSNAIARVLVQMSATMRLANPLLMLSAPVDAAVRGTLLDARRLLTGESGSQLAQLMADKSNGATSQYETGITRRMARTGRALASDATWRSKINKDLYWLGPAGVGRIERATSATARKMAAGQDVFFLTRNDVVGRRYVESLIKALQYRPEFASEIGNILTYMDRDHMWAFNNLPPDILKEAENTLADLRGLKTTTASLMLRNIVDPLSNDRRWYISIPSTLGLKLPLLFQNFYFNVLTSMAGLQSVNAISALIMQGNQGGKRGGRIRAAIAGEPYDAERHGTNWIEETLESMDIADAFIQSGISHTAVMAAGMMAGGLGLGGGDDEERRRRKAARAEGFAYLYDPRSVQNDFRNADAVWFDGLPSWVPFSAALKEMFQVSGVDDPGGEHSMAQLHWTLKQFISPLVGIARYFDTGNAMDIVWGFEDAIGSMPLARVWDWDNAQAMAAELHAASQDAEQRGNPEDLPEAYGFLLSMVSTLERQLFENSFVNTLYQTWDHYDRNPWALPEIDTNGAIARDNLGQPMSTNALKDYIGEEGTASAYMQRSWNDAQLHALTENRATLALMLSLFTGQGESDFLRTNMVPTTRTIDKPEITQEAATELILSVWDAENEAEILTADGAEAVFRGLYEGTVSRTDPVLANVFVPLEMRQAIHDKMLSDLIQDALDAGLDESKAKSWANDVFYGNSAMGTQYTSLRDIIWNTPEISYAQSSKYYQLNTTYIMGPDGRAWATGIDRARLGSFFGMAPLQRYGTGDQTMGADGRLNSVDEIRGINTGMRMLQKIDDSWANPTAEDILAAIEKAGESANSKAYTPYEWQDFGSGYGSGYGGGGGYASIPNYGGSWQRLNTPNGVRPPYNLSTRDANSGNPYVRRATIRRERFESQRGRLNQWQ